MENSPTSLLVVALALQDSNGRWLMHRRPLDKAHGGLWEFPGGKVESHETLENALIREIGEELGISLDAGDLSPAGFAKGSTHDGRGDIVILLYTCRRWTGTPQALEGEDIGWFETDEIAGLDRPPLDVALCRGLFG